MAIKKDRLQAVLAVIKANKSRWNQKFYHRSEDQNIGCDSHTCGASHCFAGWGTTIFVPRMTYNYDTWDEAIKIFGITEEQANVLFAPTNKLKHLEEYVDVLCGKRKADSRGYTKAGVKENSPAYDKLWL